jgi:hypothetical protein
VKVIQGRFVNSSNNLPISYGWISLQLKSAAEDEAEDDLNIGIPLAPSAPLTEEEKEEFKWSNRSYTFTLDADGRIPPGSEIWGNDELAGDTWYHVSVSNDLPRPQKYYWEESLKITGPGPIDINAIIPEGFVPEPEPEPVKPPRVVAPRRPGSTANHVGFFGVTISYPAKTGSTAVPAIDERVFGFCAFTLPFRAIVGCASIIVDGAAQGNENTLLLGLYDADGKKKCATAIDVCNGLSTGEFESPVPLAAGDYYLAFGVARHSSTLQLRCIDVDRDQIYLVNAGGGATVLGFGAVNNGSALPDKLELVSLPGRELVRPPLVYFKG